MNESIEESVVKSMDGSEVGIFPHLPFILQDFWEIGTDPQVVLTMIHKHCKVAKLSFLDLGCGKGAVSIAVAKNLGCQIIAVDAIAEFVSYAKKKAEEYKVGHLCNFQQGDIRDIIVKRSAIHDIILLGSIGQVLGNYYETFRFLSPILNRDGLIIIDDSYIRDEDDFVQAGILKRSELLNQAGSAGMEMIDENIVKGDPEDYETEFNCIVKRCNELINLFPAKVLLFENYIQKQKKEYLLLRTKLVSSVMVFKFKGD